MRHVIYIVIFLIISGVLYYIISPIFNTLEINDEEGAIIIATSADSVIETTNPKKIKFNQEEREINRPSTTATITAAGAKLKEGADTTTPTIGTSLTSGIIEPLNLTSNTIATINPVRKVAQPTTKQETLQLNKANVQGTAGHPASGTVRLIQREDGSRFLRFENFQTINGPNLHVYLAKSKNSDDGFIDLGKIRATSGNINYEIDKNINLDEYNHILHWCVPFGVLFNWAKFN